MGKNSDFFYFRVLVEDVISISLFWHFIISYVSQRSVICTLVRGFMVIHDKSVSPLRSMFCQPPALRQGVQIFGILIK